MKKRCVLVLVGGLLAVMFALAQTPAFHDPTMPLTYREKQQEELDKKNQLVVSMILVSNHRSIAVINGESLEVGDVINGVKIIAIDQNKVTVEKGDKVWTIEWMANIMSDEGE